MSNKIYLYTDEAGNTGTDLFNDIHQSFFYTATIFSKKDIDINKNIKNKFETILLTLQSDNSQIKEIHFTELNEEEKSFVTNEIIDILEEYNLELLISIIEKKYLPKLFFIDEFFDSGINPIIPFDIYNIRIHRFFLVFGITQNFTDEDSERFYKLFRSMDTEKIILFIKEIKPKLLNNQSGIYKVLIDKALTYVIENIENFIFRIDTKYLLPNYHILNLIMHYTRFKYKNVKSIFKHDYNSNILKGLPKKLLPISFKWDADTSDFATITDIKEDKTFDNGISFIDSKNSYGIQIADVFVSFYRLYNEDKIKDISKFKKIIDYINQTPLVGISNQLTINTICSYDKYINSGEK
jgi:hypothetical protein